jgi:tetratricopeptide (TPR) repeat protein
LYVLTRPCVFGACEPLQKAQQLDQEVGQTIQNTNSALAIKEAHDQLAEASYLLSTIPFWSGRHQEAQTLLARFSDKAEVLGQVVDALEHGNAAAQKSQNPPHPVPQWREIQWLWQDAIAKLEKIPANSPVYPLVQRKLKEYQANLNSTNQRVIAEQNAQDKVTAARKTAQVAESRVGTASSATNWQQAFSTWESAINLLRQVPQGTMAHAEADQLIAIYQPKLAEANNHRSQEQLSANAYNQAMKLSQEARDLGQQNQWTQAVESWQNALNNVRQVPNGTTYFNDAQSLVNSYTTALNQAEENLRRSQAMQSAKPTLDQTCDGSPKICTYMLAVEAIRVQITPEYDQVVENMMVHTQVSTNNSDRADAVNRVNLLLRSLAAISQNTRVPVELYNSDGSKFGTYAPDLSGYVQQR